MHKFACIRFAWLGLTASLLLSACGSTPAVSPTRQQNIEEIPETVTAPAELDIYTVIEQLQGAEIDILEVFSIARTFIAQQNNKQARALLYAIAPLTTLDHVAQMKTLLALSLPEDEFITDDAPLLEEQPEEALETKRLSLLQTYYIASNQAVKYASTRIALAVDDVVSHHEVLSLLASLSDDEMLTAQAEFANLRPHLALLSITREMGHDVTELSAAINQFQQVYFGHPLADNLPENIQLAMQDAAVKHDNLVVLLSLSGRFAATGNTIRQGMLAAYFTKQQTENTAITLQFVDTAALQPNEIIQQASQADWVIGPLLKENIDSVIPFLPIGVKRLALNRVDPARKSELALTLADAQTAYFGLAPEDEAIQLAHHVFEAGYRHPIIVASSMGVGQRMLQAFNAEWRRLQSRSTRPDAGTFDIVEFDTIDNLGDTLAKALGVGQSDENISQINRMTNRILYDQTRSRQDIDTIVVFASPEQMALINPMVEASISPFRQQVVPVYATSRSLDRTDAPNQLRDLENVRFLDAPFLLQPEKWQQETAQVNALWPEQSAAFARLYAFGYDAITMLDIIPRLGLLPAYRYSGLTGTLSMNKDAEIERHLPMARIHEQRILPMTQGE